MKTLNGKKVSMTQVFKDDGEVIAVTRVDVEQEIDRNLVGEQVTVVGTSKGKGFAGVVKRWSFAGGPKTHGQSDRHRAPGSIGERTDPGKVWKGQRMGGRMGSDKVTVKKIEVIDVVGPHEMWLKGAIPGGRNAKLVVKIAE